MPIRTLTLCVLIISSMVLNANAQDQSPNEILEASKSALQEIDGFSAQFRMKAKGAAMFKDTLPSMSGQLFFGSNNEFGRVIHCIGEAREQQTKPSLPMDILIVSDRFLWTDLPKRTIHERPASSGSRGIPTAIPLVLLKSIVQNDPYATDADDAESIDLLTQETVGGVLCDVIHIKRSKQEGRTSRSGSDAYTDARWYIGADDKLPRKLEHITDAGFVKITLIFELSNLKVTSPPQDMLDVTRPNGFAFKSTMPKPTTDSPSEPTADKPTEQSFTNQRDTAPIAPRARYAPPYSFTSAHQSEINNNTQDQRVTVLYFWGSWCIPCDETSPMVSALSEEFADDSSPVDVFALAIREANPNQTSTDFTADNYNHILVLDADPLVSLFKARVFPTLVVINGDGEIVFQKSIAKGFGAEELIDQARSAVRDAL